MRGVGEMAKEQEERGEKKEMERGKQREMVGEWKERSNLSLQSYFDHWKNHVPIPGHTLA